MTQRGVVRWNLVGWGAAGGLAAALALVALAFVPRPFGEMDQAAILSGARSLDARELAGYISYLKANLTIDSLYLLGHVVMWCGYAELLRRRGGAFSGMIAALGVVSGAHDFLENEVRWALARQLGAAPAGHVGWVLAWQTTVGMSFWALLLVSLLTAIMLWSEHRLDRLMTVVGMAALVGAAGIYSYGYLPVFLWMIVWHASSGFYLWRANAEVRADS